MADVCHVATNLSTRQDADGQTNLTFLLSSLMDRQLLELTSKFVCQFFSHVDDAEGQTNGIHFCQCDGQAFDEFTRTRLPADGY